MTASIIFDRFVKKNVITVESSGLKKSRNSKKDIMSRQSQEVRG